MSSAVVDLTGSEFEIEALPEGNALGCWASAACAASASCPASTASTASTASSAS
ncbi:thiocillin family RiPP [Rothia sp. HMSC036D11]|uniref:thiocillin family RiPP n=1 Tax=Rothia sp. HMSC036D11 TaxID=1739462 RepID=UPI00114CB37A|nr:thiocillin family RiPP [Rothia sp. HMSC036D11]